MNPIDELLRRGVLIAAPESIEIGDAVDPRRIAPGVVIHAGSKVFGSSTSIGPGCVLGREAPVTVEDCQLGSEVQLKGGFCSGAVFLDGAIMGSGAHVRAGTLLEEGAEMAHAVGLKQSIFFPFVVGGSLINFCDALMAGGRSRTEHSEIGSSFIHFNFTPRGDKATASLIGDVPRGVMAGSVLRKDVLEGGQLVVPAVPRTGRKAYDTGYRSVSRQMHKGATYIGNLAALEVWYAQVRRSLLSHTDYGAACLKGALIQLAGAREERLKRLAGMVEKISAEDRTEMSDSLRSSHEELCAGWPAVQDRLAAIGDVECAEKDTFLKAWTARTEDAYVARVQALPGEAKAAGRAWLQRIVTSAEQVI